MKIDVIKLAKEAGDARLDPLGLGGVDVKWLERFAALVIEEAAKRFDGYNGYAAKIIRATKEPE